MTLQMESTFELGTVVVLFIGRFGIIYHQSFDCNGNTVCQAMVVIEKEMLPAVDVHVYNFDSKDSYLKGTMELKFDRFGENFVSVLLVKLMLFKSGL
jgi:hypothetical protein